LDTFAFVDLEDEVDTRLPVSVTLRKWTDNLKSSQAVPRLSNSTTGSYLRPEEPSVRIQNRKIDFEKLLCDLWPSFAYYSLSVNPEEPLFVTQRTLLIFMQDCGIVYDSQEEEEEEEEDGRLWKHTARLMISKIIDDSGLDESDREGKSIGFRRFVVLLSRIAMRIYGVVRTLLFPHTHTCTHTHTQTTQKKKNNNNKKEEETGLSVWKSRQIECKRTLDQMITHKRELDRLVRTYVIPNAKRISPNLLNNNEEFQHLLKTLCNPDLNPILPALIRIFETLVDFGDTMIAPGMSLRRMGNESKKKKDKCIEWPEFLNWVYQIQMTELCSLRHIARIFMESSTKLNNDGDVILTMNWVEFVEFHARLSQEMESKGEVCDSDLKRFWRILEFLKYKGYGLLNRIGNTCTAFDPDPCDLGMSSFVWKSKKWSIPIQKFLRVMDRYDGVD